MKKISTLFFSIAILLSVVSFGQTAAKKPATAATNSCFSEWYGIFKARGAKPVTDGTHEVIVTIRGEDNTQCLMGKATVQNGKLVPPLLIQKQDGSFEPAISIGKQLDQNWLASQNKDTVYDITDGTTITFYTTDKDMVKIFFYTFVSDKAKANKVAPAPSALIKN